MSLSRSLMRFRKRNRMANPKPNGIHLEQLEPRILLSDFTYSVIAGSALDATLRMRRVDDIDTLQLINNVNQSVLQSKALSETSAVNITGGDHSDKLIVDFRNPFSIPINFTDTTTDNDTLQVIGN